MQHPTYPIVSETLGDFALDLFITPRGRFYAKASHLPSDMTYISFTSLSLEQAVESALIGCIERLPERNSA